MPPIDGVLGRRVPVRLREPKALAAQPRAIASCHWRRVRGHGELEVVARVGGEPDGGKARVDAVVQHARDRRLLRLGLRLGHGLGLGLARSMMARALGPLP